MPLNFIRSNKSKPAANNPETPHHHPESRNRDSEQASSVGNKLVLNFIKSEKRHDQNTINVSIINKSEEYERLNKSDKPRTRTHISLPGFVFIANPILFDQLRLIYDYGDRFAEDCLRQF